MKEISRKIISINNLSIGYDKKIIQKDINLTLLEGKMVCLVGKNGCGKSTLLRTLVGLQKMISGEVLIQDKPLKELAQQERAEMIALVLTERPKIMHATVWDMVKMGQMPFSKWYQKFSKSSLKKVESALSRVNMLDKKERFINELSDGEFQRVMIAKALAQDTPIIILDEPTAHLDLINRVETMILLQKLAKETHKTIIVATHELNLALQTSDKIWLMTDTNGILAGTPDRLIESNELKSLFQSDLYQLSFNRKGFDIEIK